MQRKRGELVPVAEVLSDLNGPVKAIREASPQAPHHSVQSGSCRNSRSRPPRFAGGAPSWQ